ncbi:hypothetical protein ACQUJS_23735 [Ralstonia pseudosolanacearum]
MEIKVPHPSKEPSPILVIHHDHRLKRLAQIRRKLNCMLKNSVCRIYAKFSHEVRQNWHQLIIELTKSGPLPFKHSQ